MPGMVVHAYNLSTQEANARAQAVECLSKNPMQEYLELEESLGIKARHCLQKQMTNKTKQKKQTGRQRGAADKDRTHPQQYASVTCFFQLFATSPRF
jgi:hypothetical protein